MCRANGLRDYVLATADAIALRSFFRSVSPAGIEPVGFRTKSDLRNHQAIVQPRLYDYLMVTQITLKLTRTRRTLTTRSKKTMECEFF
jgi:hypothetical protein